MKLSVQIETTETEKGKVSLSTEQIAQLLSERGVSIPKESELRAYVVIPPGFDEGEAVYLSRGVNLIFEWTKKTTKEKQNG